MIKNKFTGEQQPGFSTLFLEKPGGTSKWNEPNSMCFALFHVQLCFTILIVGFCCMNMNSKEWNFRSISTFGVYK